MFVLAYPEPRIRAPRYYRDAEARDVPAATDGDAPSWRPPILYKPAWPVTVDFATATETPITTSVTWRSRPLWPIRPPSATQWLYFRSVETAFDETPQPNPTFWSARFIQTRKAPPFVSLYYRNQTERDASVAPGQTETGHPWRAPITYKVQYPAALFQVIQQYDATGENATPVEVQPSSWMPRPLAQHRPYVGYLFRQDITSDAQPTQPAPSTTWRPPQTFKPYKLIVRFTGILGGDVPTPPTPFESTNATWFPKPLTVPKVPGSWRYIWNTPTDFIDEAPSQFTVFWQYQSNYERLVRQFFQRNLQGGARDGVAIPEQSTFPGFVNRTIRLEDVPAIARLLYRQAPPMDFDTTPEPSTFPGWVPRPLWPFMAPRGAYMYYRSGFGKDEPAPLPPPTFHGNNSVIYLRRLELLGIRLSMTAV